MIDNFICMEFLHPVLIVIACPNGSGKTSVTSQLLKHEWTEKCYYINPDIIAKEKFGDWNDNNAVMKAALFSEKLREQLLSEHKDLIFETVLSSEAKVDYIHRAKKAGYFVRLFFICTETPAINAQRIANRVIEGGHDVPITKIISRYQKSISNAIKVTRFIDRAYFYDNSIDNVTPTLLFRTYNGNIIKRYKNNIPEWADTVFHFISEMSND